LWGSWLSAVAAGNTGNPGAFVEELFELARQEASEELTLRAHHAGWTTEMFSRGDLHAAQRHTEAGIPLYRRGTYAHHALEYGGHDPRVCGCGVAGMIAALRGHLDRALLEANEALSLARELSHHGSLVHAFWTLSEVHYLRRDAAALATLTAEAVPFVTEHGSAVSAASAIIFQGWALVAVGRVDEGLASLRDGLLRWRRTGSRSLGPFRLARVADGLPRSRAEQPKPLPC
jgi:predicted ATPase